MGLYSIKHSHYPLCHTDTEKQLLAKLKLDNKLKPGQPIHLIKSNLIGLQSITVQPINKMFHVKKCVGPLLPPAEDQRQGCTETGLNHV